MAPSWARRAVATSAGRPRPPRNLSGALRRDAGDGAADDGEEALAKRLELPVADALDLAELLEGQRAQPRHVAQRRVAEDQVGRHAALLGDPPPQSAQLVEQ